MSDRNNVFMIFFIIIFFFSVLWTASAFAQAKDYRLCDNDSDCLDITATGKVTLK